MKWYRHNPSGKKAKYPGLSNEEIKSFMRINPPARLGTNVQKRQLDKEDEEDEELPSISKRVAGSSSVCTMLYPAYMRLN